MRERLSERGVVDDIKKSLVPWHTKAAAYVNSRHVVSTLPHTTTPLTPALFVTHCLATSVKQQEQSWAETSKSLGQCQSYLVIS